MPVDFLGPARGASFRMDPHQRQPRTVKEQIVFMEFLHSSPPAGGQRRTCLALEGLEERNLLSGPSHVLYDPVNGQAFTWQNQLPSERGHVNLFYDFRPRNGFPNLITPAQQALAVQALDLWSAASNGVLRFTRNITAPLTSAL